ncbi:MAG: hypothetical protein ACR2KS_04625 [Candidatus Eremiobacter antarcticus]|nr:hypothetical protein [Candidatus Eremiobacteraeota bacterium]MBC5807673.1 hypothetical protein [Candidatus Eremiobacteraeota bacterium]
MVLRRDRFTCRWCGFGMEDSVTSVLVVVARALCEPLDRKTFFSICIPW